MYDIVKSLQYYAKQQERKHGIESGESDERDLEGVISGDKGDFIWGFLKAYKTPPVTIKRIRSGDSQRNAAKIDGDIAISQKIYFRAVKQGISLEKTVEEIRTLPVFESEKIRFILVTDYHSVYAYDKKV